MFNFEKLEQRINEVFGSNEVFGKELGLSGEEITSRLGGDGEFTLSEIEKAAKLLKITPEEISSYFFEIKK
jgi:hypothetical protein